MPGLALEWRSSLAADLYRLPVESWFTLNLLINHDLALGDFQKSKSGSHLAR